MCVLVLGMDFENGLHLRFLEGAYFEHQESWQVSATENTDSHGL